MQEEIKNVTPEVVEKQKEATLREVAMYQLHRDFKNQWWNEKYKKASNKEQRETVAHHREQELNPLDDTIELKSAYYEYLCNLESSDTASVDEKQDDTSEEPNDK